MNLNTYQKFRERIYTCIKNAPIRTQYSIRVSIPTCNFSYVELFIRVIFHMCNFLYVYHNAISYTEFCIHVFFQTRLIWYAYEFIHVWIHTRMKCSVKLFIRVTKVTRMNRGYLIGQCLSLWRHSKWAILVAWRIHKTTSQPNVRLWHTSRLKCKFCESVVIVSVYQQCNRWL